jgi:uroporphyrinogen-III decarboxylase
MIDLLDSPDLAERILDIPYRYHATVAEELARLGVDMVWLGDDVGMQTGMLISPQAWRQYLKPRMSDLIARLRRINPAIKVAYHTDGDVRAVLPELIDIGIDVLHPVQPTCSDLARLKHDFGTRLSFWGSIDEQRTLPFCSPGDVRDEARRHIATLGHNGGLILSSARIQQDTPMANFMAMLEAVRDVQ